MCLKMRTLIENEVAVVSARVSVLPEECSSVLGKHDVTESEVGGVWGFLLVLTPTVAL